MSSPVQYLLAVLAILGLGTSQVVGLQSGWVCQCSGEQVIADGPDCESAGCHNEEDHDSDHDHHAPEEAPQEHQKLTRVLVGHTFLPLVVALPPQSVCEAVPGINCAFLSVSENDEPQRPAPPPSGCGPPLPASVLVARTVVMLV